MKLLFQQARYCKSFKCEIVNFYSFIQGHYKQSTLRNVFPSNSQIYFHLNLEYLDDYNLF